ncbi:MAG: hypothetical protein M5U28_47605 [Sandaracinaceae bacterium]|nr:hypothetical protein [Sandaracinaceae bacterium]
MRGSECVNVLRVNTCNQGNVGEWDGLDCQQRGDVRFKLLSYVDQPGTPFLGVAQLRGDPITGEILVGDANIGGPAMNVQRTRALEAYDIINGNITEGEYYTGEDVRAYLNALDHVELPAPPRIDFSAAMRLGVSLDPVARSGIDRTMDRAMERAEMLRGPEGRAAIFSDRLQQLAGTDLERQLVSGFDGYAMAGMDYMPEGTTSESVMPDRVLDLASPFRTDFQDRLEAARDFNTRLGLSNMMLPNEYTDDSVLSFVNQHRTWSRVRVEFELNRRLYRDTQVHEMGHCLGLRHHFGGTADPHNYFDGYYTINDEFPLPDPNDFNTDGTPGLSPAEQIAFEDAYNEARRLRELAGIDQWMNSSVMDYTPNWYQRINGASRHDYMAISFGYGDVVDIYHNVADARGVERAPLRIEEIHPVNTQRVGIKYYHGGESCSADSDCPFSTSGSRSGELLPANTDSGITQRCVTEGRDGGRSVCSSFDEDASAMAAAAGAAPEWLPVEYFYCEDIRASTRSLPGCATFDEGDSYREIVRNAMASYERDYLFSAFRRYRRTFSVGNYFGRLIRFMDPLLGIYQNLVYRYAADPEFRTQEGPFGFYDEFLATADVLNLFARMLAQPSVGSYTYNAGWEYYELTNLDVLPDAQLTVPFGQGRYLNSIYQSGLTGIWRVERIGSIYDSILAMQLMTIRGLRAVLRSGRRLPDELLRHLPERDSADLHRDDRLAAVGLHAAPPVRGGQRLPALQRPARRLHGLLPRRLLGRSRDGGAAHRHVPAAPVRGHVPRPARAERRDALLPPVLRRDLRPRELPPSTTTPPSRTRCSSASRARATASPPMRPPSRASTTSATSAAGSARASWLGRWTRPRASRSRPPSPSRWSRKPATSTSSSACCASTAATSSRVIRRRASIT